jgi:hypothetical protein
MTRSKMGFLIFGCFLLLSMGIAAEAAAQGYAPPPVYSVTGQPTVVVIPGTYVYVIPGISVDILFYNGAWYRPYEGRWYWSRSYRGPWGYMRPMDVPPVLTGLPPRHEWAPPGHQRIPYGQLKKNWKRWEREGYWERDEEWQRGRHHDDKGPGHGRGPDHDRGPGGPRDGRDSDGHDRGHGENGHGR